MNKVHVPNTLWTSHLAKLYSPENLFSLRQEIDALNNPKIRYKDHFLTSLSKYTLGKGIQRELLENSSPEPRSKSIIRCQ